MIFFRFTENLNEVLTGHLLNRLFIPLYIYSLIHQPKASNVATTNLEDMKPHMSKITALFLVSQVFLIIKVNQFQSVHSQINIS